MCGIVGVVGVSAPPERRHLSLMRDALTHRGPDDAGEWWSSDGRVGLGHRRLSIIDLSAAGHQPMLASPGPRVLVFNGEIYNFSELKRVLEARGHRFRSTSDSEVLLQGYLEWGQGVVERLNGMFAFAIYDETKGILFLARDRAGEKPLFYRATVEGLTFGSELKALMRHPDVPRRWNAAALDSYLTYGYVQRDECILEGFNKLPAASTAVYDLGSGRLKVSRYWSLPEPSREPVDDEALTEELRDLLQDSVKLRMVADVPVGILLSGGVDSSLVTALAAKSGERQVRTFTVSFPEDADYDEARFASEIASACGTDHHVLEAEAASVDLLPALAAQFDEPMADSSMVPTHLVSRLIREHATVALGGDGGDELFGGYPHYRWLFQQQRVRAAIPGSLRGPLRRGIAAALPVGLKGRNFAIGALADDESRLLQINTFFDEAARDRLLPSRRDLPWERNGHRKKKQVVPDTGSLLYRATAMDFHSYLVDDILVKVDRASMMASLEVRAPWLDHRIIELAFGKVPDRLKATRSELKVLPKRLARVLLPAGFDLDRKQGFSLPLQRWFKGDWGSFMIDVVRGADDGPFRKEAVEALIRNQQRGFANTQRLFALVMFELWRREYAISPPS